MRIVELSFYWGDGELSLGTAEAHQLVHAPAGVTATALRDAAAAVLYGSGHFPSHTLGGVQRVVLTFEVNATRHRCRLDLPGGHRSLERLDDDGVHLLSDSAPEVNERLAALMHLPDPLIYEVLSLATVGLPRAPVPLLPVGVHRALVSHARDPSALRRELADAGAAVELTRSRQRAKASPPTPLHHWPTALLTSLGLLALLVASASNGLARWLALTAPLSFGAAGVFVVRWIDGAGELASGGRELDLATGTARARQRRLEELDGYLKRLRTVMGDFDAAQLESALSAQAQPGLADSKVREQVQAYAGLLPAEAAVMRMSAALGITGAGVVSAALVLAASRAKGETAVPLFWSVEGSAATAIAWSEVFAALGDQVPMFVFSNRPITGEGRS